MRKIISSLLVFAMLFTSCVMCFAGSAEADQERCSVEVSLGQKDEVAAQVCENQEEGYVAQDLELNCENGIGLRPSGIITEVVLGLLACVGVPVVVTAVIAGIVALTSLVGESGVTNIMLLFK